MNRWRRTLGRMGFNSDQQGIRNRDFQHEPLNGSD